MRECVNSCIVPCLNVACMMCPLAKHDTAQTTRMDTWTIREPVEMQHLVCFSKVGPNLLQTTQKMTLGNTRMLENVLKAVMMDKSSSAVCYLAFAFFWG